MSNIFIISMIFVLFTQLRLFSLPIGFGELGLIFLGIMSFIKLYKLNKIDIIKYISGDIFIRFWLLSFLLLIFSYIWIHITGIHHTNTNLVHDILAYLFIFYIIVLLVVLNKYINIDFEKLMLKMLSYTVIIYVIILIITYFFGDDLSITKTWPTLERFIGLSNNPNQVGLLFIVIPFILMSFYNKQNIEYKKIYIILLFIFSLLIAYYVRSRGLQLAWIISIAVIIYYKLYSISSKNIKTTINILTLLVGLIIIFYFYDLQSYIFRKGVGSYSHRLELWTNALELIQSSPLVGFGPGAHVGSVINTTHYWEVHNTFLDFMLQTGFIGLALYIFLLYKIGNNIVKNGDIYLLAAFLSLIVFSTFHFVLRHPIFWFYLFYFYQIGREKKCAE